MLQSFRLKFRPPGAPFLKHTSPVAKIEHLGADLTLAEVLLDCSGLVAVELPSQKGWEPLHDFLAGKHRSSCRNSTARWQARFQMAIQLQGFLEDSWNQRIGSACRFQPSPRRRIGR